MALDSPKASISQAWATGHTSTGTLEEWKIWRSLEDATRAIHFELSGSFHTSAFQDVVNMTEDWPAASSQSAGLQESTNHRPLLLFNPLAAAIQDN